MPSGTDYTEIFQSFPFVREYVLIGPRDTQRFGKLWETWGKPDLFADPRSYKDRPTTWESRGFMRQHNPLLSKLVLGSDDRPGMVGFNYVTHFIRIRRATPKSGSLLVPA